MVDGQSDEGKGEGKGNYGDTMHGKEKDEEMIKEQYEYERTNSTVQRAEIGEEEA
jgi:hypothetical protein